MSICAGCNSDHRQRPARRAVVHIAVALAVTATWIAPASFLAQEKNLASARNGAQVIKYTSEQGGARRAEKVIDEHAPPGGWASADGSLPQEIIVRLPASARFNTLVFNLDSGAPESEWARDVSIYAADPFPTMGGWKLVADVRLARETTDQTFSVDQMDGRFIRLLIREAQSSGASRVTLGQFKLFMR